jgi:hypothetical protein
MKTFLITTLMFLSSICLTPDEKDEIIKLLKTDYRTDISESNVNNISQILQHTYFGDRFSNFRKILGAGVDGIVLEVDFQLLTDYEETIPAAVKINYENLNSSSKFIKNYLNMMVYPTDQLEDNHEEDLVLFDLSQHYKKILEDDNSYKNDMPFVNMVYEAAIITVNIKVNEILKPKYANVTVTQLAFSELPGTFLPIPGESIEVMDRNSVDVARMIVQISYGLSRIHNNGFMHTDINSGNIIVGGSSENFYPMIIDFDHLENKKDFLSSAIPITEDTINEADPKKSEYLEYSNKSEYLIASYAICFNFKFIKGIPRTAIKSEWADMFKESTKFMIIDAKYDNDYSDLIGVLKDLIDTYIKEKLINQNHVNIQKLKEEIDSLKRQRRREDKFFTIDELYKKLNEASGLNLKLDDLHFINENLESYLLEIKKSRESGGANLTTEIHEENNKLLV